MIFECKAYSEPAGLTIIRNALGFRYDINEFEIVTKKSLKERQNNRRAGYAIETRTRYLFQVGVAALNDFTKPAVEFASNNKIPLLSLSWFLSRGTMRGFNEIDQSLMDTFDTADTENLYTFFKDREGELNSEKYERSRIFLNADNLIGDVTTAANTTINYSYIGLLETGDMVFLFARDRSSNNILNRRTAFGQLKAEIYWNDNRPNVWTLIIINSQDEGLRTEFDFFVPNRIMQHWQQFNLDKTTALDIKRGFFSKIFVFNKSNNDQMPFSIVNLDENWLDQAVSRLIGNNDV